MYDLFSDFFDSFDVFPVYREDRRCPKCGRSYYEFQKSGRFGCAECYNTFYAPVKASLGRIQKGTTHIGKIPGKKSAGLLKKRQLTNLKEQLSAAVSREDYELAAKLHKEIKSLEGSL